MAVVKNLMVRAGADFSGMRRGMQKAQRNIYNFKNSLSRTMGQIRTIVATTGGFLAIRSATKDAMTFEASLQQIERTMGSSFGIFQQWAKGNAQAFGMGRLEVAKYGAVYSNLLSNFTRNTAQTAQYTQDLLKASAVVASSTGRTMEDVMDRIRSGLLGNTEAIEDLGINVNVAMIESTKAFRRFAGDRSWQQLDFQTQQQIRLFAILEQAAGKYGVEIADNTTSRQAKFLAQLKNIKLALGQAFLPIYNTVLPALTRLATGLANAMNAVAQFTQALFGGGKAKQQVKTTENQANAVTDLGDAYQAAGKKAKGAVAGFDEINQLADSAGGGAAGSVNPLGAMVDNAPASNVITETMTSISEKAQEMAAKVKSAYGEMSSFVREHSDIIISALAGVGAAFATAFVVSKWTTIITAIKGAFLKIGTAIAAISLPVAIAVAAIGALVAAFVYFYRTNETFRDTVHTILQKIGEVALWLWQNVLVPFGAWLGSVMVAEWDKMRIVIEWLWINVLIPLGEWLMTAMVGALNAVRIAARWLWLNVLVPLGNFLLWIWHNAIMPLAKVLTDILGVAFKVVANIAKSFWQNVLVPLGSALAEMFGPTVEAVSAVLGFLWKNVFVPLGQFLGDVFKQTISELINVFTFLWKNVLKPVAEFVGGIFYSVFNNVFISIGTIIDGLKTAFIGLMNFITGVFTGDWEKAWNGVKDIIKGVFESMWGIVKFPLNLIIDGINRVIGGLNKISIKVPDWVPGYGGKRFGINIPKIPKLARGGIIDSPTVAMLGERGPEAVVPLENTSFVDSIASAVGTAVLHAMQAVNINQSGISEDREIALEIDGVKLGRLLLPKIDAEIQRIGGTSILKMV